MHYEKGESAPTKWIDILRGSAEATLPPLYDTLIAEFSGEDEVERGRRIAKWRFFKDVNNDLTPKMIRGIEERVRDSFVIKHSYAYQLRNTETEETMAYFQNKRSPWFERISEAKMVGKTRGKSPPERKHRAPRQEMGF